MSGSTAPVGFDPRDVFGGEAGIGTGRLPKWVPYALAAGSLALAILLLVATGKFSPVLLVIATAAFSSVSIYGVSRAVESPRQAKDRLVTVTIASAFAMAMLPLASLLYTVIDRGMARFDTAFFTESARNVVGEGGGAIHAIWGTLIITGVATVISVPIGIMAAIYLQEYGKGKRLARYLTFFVDVMTGIPSIVAGLFAYALFSLILGPGIRLGVIGAVALSVLMIPIVIRSAEEMLKIVPDHLREAAYALGDAEVADDRQGRPAHGARGNDHRRDARGRPDHRRDGPAAGDRRRHRFDQLQPLRRADGDPPGLRLLRVQEPGDPAGGRVRPRLGSRADADRDRAGPELPGPAGLPPVRYGDSLKTQWKRTVRT